MIVQTTNTGGDLGSNQFDLAIPGGGVGLFNACTDEWNAPSSGWGAQYGGISSNTCSTFPKALQAGCGFRFDWFEGADNPEVEFERVECPAEIVAKSGCKRDDDGAQVKVAEAAASSSSAAAQEATVASSSVEAASSASSTSESASIATSSEAIASSAEAYTAPAVESSAATYTTPTPESSAAYTSAPAMASSPSSSPSSSAADIEVSSTPLSSTTTPSSPASSEDAACNVQYVYEYDL
jgi:hypothetical protein